MNIRISEFIKDQVNHRRRSAVVIFVFMVSVFLFWPVSSYRIKGGESLRVFSREGVMLREFSSAGSGGYEIWLKLSDFPQSLIDTVLAAEDRRFYFHPGFDPIAIARSARQNVISRKIVSGGSTITQQLVRIAYADLLPRNPFVKKAIEIILAFRLETHFSKKEILESYLNRVPMKFNQNGLPAASRRIFGRDIRFISKEEGTALVVLIRENQASRENFRKRYLSLMKRAWKIDAVNITGIEGNIFRAGGYEYTDSSSGTLHFEEFIRSLKIDAGGDVKTSLSANLNNEIKKIIITELRFLNPYKADNCAVVVLKLPEKGGKRTELAAMVGSENFHDESSGQVNGCISVRQAGSTLKPFIYGYAMDNLGYRPYSIINDSPLAIGVNSDETYSPKNNDLKYWGPITLREALACSRNIPAVAMVNKIGLNDFYRYLRTAGFSHMEKEPSYYGPGLALGTGGASLLQLCRAYSGIACGGRELPLYIGSDSSGDILLGDETVLFTEATSYRLTHILSDSEARRKAFGSRNFLDFPFDVAAKTGTSKDFRDAWTIGYTDKYVVGVWVGNFSGKQMNSITGGWGAGRIFHQVIRLVTGREKPSFYYPESFRMVKFCRVSGLYAGNGCQYCMEPVDAAEKPLPVCGLCGGGYNHISYYSASGEPEIISPADGESFVIDPLIPSNNQQIPVKIYIKNFAGGESYFYSVDDHKLIPLAHPVEKTIEPLRGRHFIKIFRNDILVKSVSFTVE